MSNSGNANGHINSSSLPASELGAVFRNSKNYEELNLIGSGAYGTVYQARDLMNAGQIVALKKVKVPLTEDGIPLSTLREIALLRQLEAYQHPNIVRLLDVCHGGGTSERDQQLTLFLVFEHVEQDLSSYLKRLPCSLSERRIREMMHDILSGIDFLHSHRIVHRDIKPQNLLVTSGGRVKLADFGLAKTFDSDMRLTSLVVTLWYRPPEVLLGRPYNTAVDVWSAGCVFCELYTRDGLFKGYTEAQQLDLIFRVIGRPSRGQWPDCTSVDIDNFPAYKKKDFEEICPRISANAKQLVQGMLLFEPSERLTALDCLQHTYFTEEIVS